MFLSKRGFAGASRADDVGALAAFIQGKLNWQAILY